MQTDLLYLSSLSNAIINTQEIPHLFLFFITTKPNICIVHTACL